MLSTEVSIFNPNVGEAAVGVSASLTAVVSPEHATVTAPAATVDVAARVMVMALFKYAAPDTALGAGVCTSQDGLPAIAVTNPEGNVRVILPLLGMMLDVVNVTDRVRPTPTAAPMVKALAEVAVTHPTQGVLT